MRARAHVQILILLAAALAAGVAGVAGVAGCAGDPYRPYEGGVGFSEAEVAPDVWQVIYEGPRRMSYGQATHLARRRAAELAARAGKPYFRIVEAQPLSRIHTDLHRHYDPYDRRERRGLYGPGYDLEADTYARPGAILRVRLLDEAAPDAFETRRILQQDASSTQPA